MNCRDPRHGVEWDALGNPRPCARCAAESIEVREMMVEEPGYNAEDDDYPDFAPEPGLEGPDMPPSGRSDLKALANALGCPLYETGNVSEGPINDEPDEPEPTAEEQCPRPNTL